MDSLLRYRVGGKKKRGSHGGYVCPSFEAPLLTVISSTHLGKGEFDLVEQKKKRGAWGKGAFLCFTKRKSGAIKAQEATAFHTRSWRHAEAKTEMACFARKRAQGKRVSATGRSDTT